MKGCDAFSVRHIDNFIHFSWHDLVTLFVNPCGTDFIFAFIVESSSITTADMRAFSVVPQSNMSTAKSFSIAFELPP